MKYKISFDGHGTPFTLVRCPIGFAVDKICSEVISKKWKAKDVEKNYAYLKAIDFEKSDKEFVFVVKSLYPFSDASIEHIKKTLVEDNDGVHFCLGITVCYEVDRIPKMLLPFI